MKFVFIDQDVIIKNREDLKPLYELGTVDIYGDRPKTIEEIVKRGKDAVAIFFATTKFPNELLDKLPNLKVLQFLGTGVWNLVDVAYAKERGIKVLNIEGYGNNAVAEFSIASALSLARNIPRGDRNMRNEVWDLADMEGIEIQGATFGVVGTGNIGRLVAIKAAALGADVLAFDIVKDEELERDFGVRYTSLTELFSKSDFISIHVKAMKATYGLITCQLINSMKSSAFFINAARAEVVDNKALHEALSSRRIRGAALDAFEHEPPKDYGLIKLDNVITTPHIGFFTNKSSQNMLAMSLASILKELKATKLV